jgi:hypothetical protein
MRLITCVFVLALFSPLTASADQELPNMRLLKPAFAFHTCVENEARVLLQSSSPKIFASGSEAEGWLWRRVIDKCFPVLTKDEVQGIIHQNYQGNQQRMIDFRDGLLWVERSYVFTQVADWYAAGK